MKTIAFDVDGTLIRSDESPRWDIIAMLKTLQLSGGGNRIIVWSGGGKDYADLWVRRLFLKEYVDEIRSKPMGEDYKKPDIAFDDEEVDLGIVNIRV